MCSFFLGHRIDGERNSGQKVKRMKTGDVRSFEKRVVESCGTASALHGVTSWLSFRRDGVITFMRRCARHATWNSMHWTAITRIHTTVVWRYLYLFYQPFRADDGTAADRIQVEASPTDRQNDRRIGVQTEKEREGDRERVRRWKRSYIEPMDETRNPFRMPRAMDVMIEHARAKHTPSPMHSRIQIHIWRMDGASVHLRRKWIWPWLYDAFVRNVRKRG